MAADVCPGFEHTRKGMQCELEFVQHALVEAETEGQEWCEKRMNLRLHLYCAGVADQRRNEKFEWLGCDKYQTRI